MSMLKRLAKEVYDQETLGGNLREEGIEWYQDESDVKLLHAFIFGPIGSCYEGGVFEYEVRLPDDYPFKPPKFKAVTRLFHPEVTDLTDGTMHFISSCSACGLGEWWSPALTVTKVLKSARDSMKAPDIDKLDCCSPTIRKTIEVSKEEFESKAREWT